MVCEARKRGNVPLFSLVVREPFAETSFRSRNSASRLCRRSDKRLSSVLAAEDSWAAIADAPTTRTMSSTLRFNSSVVAACC